MNDHIKSEILSYLAGDLPESRNRQIEAHAAACEKCRNALSKTRAKQARVKREALKKASTDEMPNFFLARQRRLAGLDVVSRGKSGMVLAVLILGGVGYWGFRTFSAGRGKAVIPNAVQPNDVQRNDVPQNDVPVAEAPPVKKPTPEPAEEEPKPPVVLSVIEEWKGPDSAVADSRLMVIRNAEAWQNIRTEMALPTPLPEVDFTKQLVLGVFAGEKQTGTSILLGRVEAGDTEVSAPYRFILPAAPAAVQNSTEAAPAPTATTHPYLLAVIPRVEKKIRLTQKEKRS